MTTKRQYFFEVADRIAERPKFHALFATRQEALEIAKLNSSQRYGTVVNHTTKINKRGQKCASYSVDVAISLLESLMMILFFFKKLLTIY